MTPFSEMPPTGFVEEMVINYLTVAERFAAQVGDGARAARLRVKPHESVEHGAPSLEVAVELSGRQLVVEQLDGRVRPVRGQHDLHGGRTGRERAFARHIPGVDPRPRRRGRRLRYPRCLDWTSMVS